MVKQLILILVLMTLPAATLAAESSLGPTTGGTGTSDPGTGSILQPAPTSLQGTGSDLQQPLGQSSIQQPATREQVEQYLAGELAGPKGAAPEPEAEPQNIPILLILAGLFLLGVAFTHMLNRRKIAPTENLDELPVPAPEIVKTKKKKPKSTKKKTSRPRK